MRQLFVPKTWIDTRNHQVVLVDDPFHHLIHVLRKKRGQWVEAFDGEGGTYRAQILDILPDKAVLEVGERKAVTQAKGIPLTLGVAVLKGKSMNWVIQKVTELGVRTIVPLLTHRTVARPGDHAATKVAKWEKIAVEAAKQCGVPFVPNIYHPIRFADFLKQTADYDARLLAWEGPSKQGEQGLRAWATQWWETRKETRKVPTVLLIVGPEGGFDPAEVQLAKKQGCVLIGLGQHILRSETAALVASAIVSYELKNFLPSPLQGERVG